MRKIILLLLLSYGGIAIATTVTVNNQTGRNLMLGSARSVRPVLRHSTANANTTKRITMPVAIARIRVYEKELGTPGNKVVAIYPPAKKDFEITITENPDKTLTISGPYGTVTTKPLP